MRIRQRWWGGRSKLSCRQVGKVLQSHLDSELGAEASRRVAQHLDDCRRCGLEAETYAALHSALARRGELEPERLDRLREFGARLAAGGPGTDPGFG